MNKYFIIILCVSFLTACSGKNKIPDNVLPMNKMKDVMWDMIRAGVVLDGPAITKDSIDKGAIGQKWFNKIYELHKISKEQFVRSYSFYNEHPLLLKEILDSLSKKQVNAPPVSPGTLSAPAVDSFEKKSAVSVQADNFRKAISDSIKRKKNLKKIKLSL